MNQVKGTRVVKQLNRSRILGVLREGPTTRVALAKELTLSKNTVSLLVDELIAEGLVEQMGPRESGVGRPAIEIRLNPSSRLVVGVQFLHGALDFAVTGLDAVPIDQFSLPVPGAEPADVIATLRTGMNRIAPRKSLLGVGLGVPGLVDPANRVVVFSRLDWRDVPLAQLAEDAVGLPSYVINTVRAAALAELWYGTGQGRQNFLYCSLGAGVGGALVINGQLYQGHLATAGELGHMTVVPDGPLCTCGNRGCLEALVGEPGLIARVRELMRSTSQSGSRLWEAAGGDPGRLQAAHITDAAAAGDPVAGTVLAEVAEYLAIALGNLINVFNPEEIIITTRLTCWQQALSDPLTRALQRRALHVPLHGCQITWSELGPRAGPIGAAALALTRTGWSF